MEVNVPSFLPGLMAWTIRPMVSAAIFSRGRPHNAHVDYRTGQATRAPACIDPNTWPVKVEGGEGFIGI